MIEEVVANTEPFGMTCMSSQAHHGLKTDSARNGALCVDGVCSTSGRQTVKLRLLQLEALRSVESFSRKVL